VAQTIFSAALTITAVTVFTPEPRPLHTDLTCLTMDAGNEERETLLDLACDTHR